MSRRIIVAAALSLAALAAAVPALAAPVNQQQQQTSRKISQREIGPWSIIGWVAPSGVGYCSAERDAGDTRIAFVRFPQGYALILRSPGWNLRPEGDYPVKFAVAFVTSGRAAGRVLAPNIILVQLTSDPAAMRQIAGGQSLEVEAADTKVSVPLAQFADALAALDTCLAQTPQPGQAQEPPQRSPDPQPPRAPGNFPGAPSKKLPDFKSDHVMLVTKPRAVA
ncbi:MAG: hypothetical protein IT538_09700 [Variibacter sp.]|nr:hypothetical protein [Variibacter sp.]